MDILIIEDELPSARHLQRRLVEIDKDVVVLDILDSIETSVDWLSEHAHPALIFMDIQLADGLSFQIFDRIEVNSPVIFTTAFDQYALDAFRVKSIDYLLKPIVKDDLKRALNKYHTLTDQRGITGEVLEELRLRLVPEKRYRERFLIKVGDQFKYLKTSEILHLSVQNGLVEVVDTLGKRNLLDEKVESLISKLDPRHFFRINRQQVVHIDAIDSIHTYFNSRLKLSIAQSKQEWIVARDRVKDFKNWMEQ